MKTPKNEYDITEWVPAIDELPEIEDVPVPLLETEPESVDALDSHAAHIYAAVCMGDD